MGLFNLPVFAFLKQLGNGFTQTPVSDTDPLPVKLVTAAGQDVNINASNLNLEVQLSAVAPEPDSVRIGDGTDELQITSNGKAHVALYDQAGTPYSTSNPLAVNAVSVSSGVSTPTIYNVSVPAAVESNVTLPADAKRYKIRFRGSAKLQVAYEPSATEYEELPRGCFLEETNLADANLTVYFKSSDAGTVELTAWV